MNEALEEKLARKMEEIKEMLQDVVEDNRQMSAEIEALEARVDSLENYSKRNNLVVGGIPMVDGENPLEVAIKTGEAMGIKVVPNEIDIAHVLPTRGDRSGLHSL